MRERSIKMIFVKNMFLFLVFGIVVSVITTYVNYNMQHVEVTKKVSSDSAFISNRIISQIKSYLDKVEASLNAIETNKLFIDYLLNPNEELRYTTKQLFINSMKNNNNFFQFRFIDAKGMENIRVDRERESGRVFVVDDTKLQNKSDRYYFEETINKSVETYWHSKLDLNVERGQLEKPYRPTYRVSTNVYYKGIFYGILIVNVEVQNLLAFIKGNNKFDTYLSDGEGYFITHPIAQKSWGKYLNTGYTIYQEFPSLTVEAYDSNDFGTHGYLFPLEKYFQNSENIKLALVVKKEFLDSLVYDNLIFAITLGSIILLVSIPVGLIISIPTSKVYMDFNKLNKENSRYMETIDKYIPTMNVSLDGTIIDVSGAFCRLTGYTKNEIVGKKPSIFNSGKMDQKIYENLWDRIKSGYVWHGELEDKNKSGESYWVDITILPNFSEDNTVESYTSISENITDKKLIEKVSQTDKLTQTYNRVKLDKTLEYELHRFLRHYHTFSVILIDIDHFKPVNDNYGHQVGDNVLIELSKLLKKYARASDIVGRWGGEEFMIICVNTEIKGATKLAENFRKSVEEFEFDVVGYKTISIGVSEVRDTDNTETLIKRVDDCLYEAKRSGRNKVVFSLD